ncbi:DNA repair protein RecN [Rubrobacter naiadicus]|uniref:DNA repair protein RecN n=1 Tax=Rubrobacter naiadicus TaxID=1392641 RepID=UPI00236241BE|nr:DNA repair protein RecN [Rubrobacter naiadicus]
MDVVAGGEEDLLVVLSRLSVENVALIERVSLEFEPGLNVITGETGTGKTLLATALQLLLGARARAETVRAGAQRATIEGEFGLPGDLAEGILRETLGDLAEEIEPEDGIVLRRTITPDGRSRCYVCGVSVPVRALAALGGRLVSYHGQREQARLSDPSEQLAILDDFLDEGTRRAREEHAALWTEVERKRRQLEDLKGSEEARLRELDFLRYQISEIEESGYSAREVEELRREQRRLRNVAELAGSVAAAAAALSSEEGGASEALASAARELESASRHDEELSGLAGRLSGLSAELDDVLYELRSYANDLEADPARLEEVEARLEELRSLERKYGEDVPGYLEEARERLSRLENFEAETAGLEREIEEGAARLDELAGRLSEGRREAARTLSQRVQENLEGLNLGQSVFRAVLEPAEAGPSGRERVEFVVQPNPGEPELAVRSYASGGELSRIMLAIRLAQRREDPALSYVFDEVDAGIGGETATAVGRRLEELGRRCQVLTITHLPQIASVAGSHVVVSKGELDGRTVTRAVRVEGEERRREIARMLSGRVDGASLAHAARLLEEE